MRNLAIERAVWPLLVTATRSLASRSWANSTAFSVMALIGVFLLFLTFNRSSSLANSCSMVLITSLKVSTVSMG